jgi:hypothetical protein
MSLSYRQLHMFDDFIFLSVDVQILMVHVQNQTSVSDNAMRKIDKEIKELSDPLESFGGVASVQTSGCFSGIQRRSCHGDSG